MHREHPSWFASSPVAFEEKADRIWAEMQTSIPTTFLIELQETVNDRHIMMNNQIPSI